MDFYLFVSLTENFHGGEFGTLGVQIDFLLLISRIDDFVDSNRIKVGSEWSKMIEAMHRKISLVLL